MPTIPTAHGSACSGTRLRSELDYKVRNGIPTFERALEELLAQERELAAASKSGNG